jgi:uncharacterized protein YdhG (YjbR/CyaY superfamily)
MNLAIKTYNTNQNPTDQSICDLLANIIDTDLNATESKIWHAHPVWFLEGNPIVGYSKQKKGIRLMFWSGVDFDEEKLNVKGAKFKDASIFYNETSEVNVEEVKRWIEKSKTIQWDYKNIVKRNGKLERIV